jgi:hypothetical protein
VPGEIKIRFEVMLSTEAFQGADHPGDSQKAYGIAIPMMIFEHESELHWRQLRDSHGHIDPRMPPQGLCEPWQISDLLLKDTARKPVAVLQSFEPANLQSNQGTIAFKYELPKQYGAQPASRIDWRGNGKWTVLENNYTDPAPSYFTSAWTFVTSSGVGGGALIVAGAGNIILTDPHGVEWTFGYLGAGLGAGVKAIKGIQLPSKIPKIGGRRLPNVPIPDRSGGGSLPQLPSGGWVFKNPNVTGSRELTKEDIQGQCGWLDGSVVVGLGAGVTVLAAGIRPNSKGGESFTAAIPFGGITLGLAAGGGIYRGYLKGAW